jgi:hypothetical protein
MHVFELARQFSLEILGFVLVGTFTVLFVHVQIKMREIGHTTYLLFTSPSDWMLPARYLKVRKQRGWSPWPVYLMWPCLIGGLVLIVIGLFGRGSS